MVRFNLLTLTGFIVSAASIPIFWFWGWLGMYAFGSGDTELIVSLRNLGGAVSVLFMLGTFLSLLSPLGAALQIPGTLIMPMLFWYREAFTENPAVVALYSIGMIGCSLTTLSIFVQVFRGSETGQMIPWYKSWRSSRGEPALEGRPVPLLVRILKPAIPKPWLTAIVLSALVATAGFSAYTLTQPVSTMRIDTMFEPTKYGNELDIAIYVDNRLVAEDHVAAIWGFVQFTVDANVDPGKHEVAIDFANSTATLDGIWEYSTEVRVLPYTSDYFFIGFDVWLI